MAMVTMGLVLEVMVTVAMELVLVILDMMVLSVAALLLIVIVVMVTMMATSINLKELADDQSPLYLP